MRDFFVQFGAETKFWADLLGPASHRWAVCPVVSGVEFDGVEVSRIVREKLSLGCAWRIDLPSEGTISPLRRAHVQTRRPVAGGKRQQMLARCGRIWRERELNTLRMMDFSELHDPAS